MTYILRGLGALCPRRAGPRAATVPADRLQIAQSCSDLRSANLLCSVATAPWDSSIRMLPLAWKKEIKKQRASYPSWHLLISHRNRLCLIRLFGALKISFRVRPVIKSCPRNYQTRFCGSRTWAIFPRVWNVRTETESTLWVRGPTTRNSSIAAKKPLHLYWRVSNVTSGLSSRRLTRFRSLKNSTRTIFRGTPTVTPIWDRSPALCCLISRRQFKTCEPQRWSAPVTTWTLLLSPCSR